MRASDAIHVIRLHLDVVKAFEAVQQSRVEDDWTEEDDAEFADMVEELKVEEDAEEVPEEEGGREGEERRG